MLQKLSYFDMRSYMHRASQGFSLVLQTNSGLKMEVECGGHIHVHFRALFQLFLHESEKQSRLSCDKSE